MGTGDTEFVMDVLRVFVDGEGSLFWTEREDGSLEMLVNCNDLFFWATADAEQITPENLPILKQAIADVEALKPHFGTCYGTDLFCARVRGMRPQQPCYKHYPDELKPLFDAAGPPRDRKSEG